MTIIVSPADTVRDLNWLEAAVADWVHRADPEFTGRVRDFIAFGEGRIYRTLRIRAMEVAFSATIADGVVAVPDRYLEMKYLYLDGGSAALERKGAEWIYQTYPTRTGSGSNPAYFAREVDSFIFGPYPADGSMVRGVYYQRLPALTEANSTNWFTDNAPDLLLFAALAEAELYVRNDGRSPTWDAKYAAMMAQIDSVDKAEYFSGSTLQIRVS